MEPTYEELRADAREKSRSLGRYAAVVEITTYMGSRSRTTVMVSTDPIKSFSRGGQFVGLVCQFRSGQPYGDGRLAKPEPTKPILATDDNKLPF